MNLVCFEYAACQARKHGVLILSEFAGAASFMKDGCITFHPANRDELSDAIYRGITMGSEERGEKYDRLRTFIDDNTRFVTFFFFFFFFFFFLLTFLSAKWGETFIDGLSKCQGAKDGI